MHFKRDRAIRFPTEKPMQKTSTRENLLGERNERLVQLVRKYHGTANAIFILLLSDKMVLNKSMLGKRILYVEYYLNDFETKL